MDFMEISRKRKTVRKFSQAPVEQEKLEKILEAGCWSPTAVNLQPQRILVLNTSESLSKVRKFCSFGYDQKYVDMVKECEDGASIKVEQVQIENDDLIFHEKNYQALEQNLNNLQTQRQHQRKYILNLLDNLNKQDYTSLRKSLENALLALNNAYAINTGQETMNRIISSFLPLISEKNIQLYTSYYDDIVPLNKQDYSLLISTLITHAIRQCQEPYKIMIDQYQVDHHYILEIRYTSKEIEPVDVYFHSNMSYMLKEPYVIMRYQVICR